ncbi:MAG: pilus assembly protein PilP [Thermodesulfovibrio sp.]|nr:pilus assembly protein PilP [Thermodesulfovibrio sp.]
MTVKRRVLIISGIFILALIVGIAAFFIITKTEKPKEYVFQIKKEEIAKSEPPPPPPSLTFPTYSYDVADLRDPFAPLIVRKPAGKKLTTPLEGYDIDELKLTGVAIDEKGKYALLQTPDGRFYVARENDRVGLYGGKITKILKDSIEITEGPHRIKLLKLRMEE